MDLGSQVSVPELVEYNGEIRKGSVSGKLSSVGESEVHNNGACVVESNDNNELFPEAKQNGPEVLGSVNSTPADWKLEVSPAHTATRKGAGLRKWRRMKRDANKGGGSSIDVGQMETRDLSDLGANLSKRMQFSGERKQTSEVSVPSTDAVVRSFDGFTVLDDSGLGLGPKFAAGTDSENSEDRSSKSSTAASAMIKQETSYVRNWMKGLSGKNQTHLQHRGQQRNSRIETTKKARGERVKIEKENSHSSMESDSRSSNFVFMQGTYSTNNGIRNERQKDYEGENDDEAQGGKQEVRGGYDRDGEGEYGNLSPEDIVAESPWEVKEERSQNHGSSSDRDPLVESISELQSTQEAIAKEVLKWKDVGQDISVDESVSDLLRQQTDIKQKVQCRSSEQLPYGEGVQSFPQGVQSEVVQKTSREVETEHEETFKRKIEAEVEYLVISRRVQKLRVASVDQITVLEEQKALALEQAQILDKLGDAESKAMILKKEAEKLESFCEDVASADETMKLQKRVCKYSSCFFMQLVLLVVTLTVFIYHISPNYMEPVPT